MKSYSGEGEDRTFPLRWKIFLPLQLAGESFHDLSRVRTISFLLGSSCINSGTTPYLYYRIHFARMRDVITFHNSWIVRGKAFSIFLWRYSRIKLCLKRFFETKLSVQKCTESSNLCFSSSRAILLSWIKWRVKLFIHILIF